MEDMRDLVPYLVPIAKKILRWYFTKHADSPIDKSLGEGIGDLIADFGRTKIERLLAEQVSNRNLYNAFKEAEICFRQRCDNENIAQALSSLPLSGLPSLQHFAEELPDSLDDKGMLETIRGVIARDWTGILSESEIEFASKLYRDCLDEKLASIADQLQATSFRITKRTAELVEAIHSSQFENETNQARQSEILEELLLVATDTHELLSPLAAIPDSAPTRPLIYLIGRSIIQSLNQELEKNFWIALIDGPGKGKTQAASALLGLVEGPAAWISLRGKVGEAADRHLLEQISLIKSHARQPTSFEARIYSPSVFQLPDNIVIVVDDLPDPLTSGNTYRILEQLFLSITQNSGKLITTSQRDLPLSTKNSFLDKLFTSSIPPFTTEEIAELLIQIGGFTELKIRETFSNLIWANTHGHPLLVSATLNWLSSRTPALIIDNLERILSGEAIQDVREEASRRALNFLDEDQREFLFRLSLIQSSFNNDTAHMVASIEPQIQHPQANLSQLSGPFIEKLEDGLFQVSAVFEKIGEHNLAENTRINVHSGIVDEFFSQRTLPVNKAPTLIAHLNGARRFTDLVYVLLQLLSSASDKAEANYISWAARLIPAGSLIEQEIPVSLLLLLRAAQIKCLSTAGLEFNKLDEEFKLLLTRDDVIEDLAFGVALIAAGPLSDGVSPISAIQRGIQGLRAIRNSGFPEHELFPESLEEVLWFPAIRMRSQQELISFIDEILNLSSDERISLFSSEIASEAAAQLIDTCTWSAEFQKSEEERVWESVIQLLLQLKTTFMAERIEFLNIPISRAIAVTYADYMDKAELAFEYLEDADVPPNEHYRFLLDYTRGYIYKNSERNIDASLYLQSAIDCDGNSFIYYRLDARRQFTLLHSQSGDINSAKQSCIDFFRWINLQEHQDIFRFDLLEMLGELAWIHWVSKRYSLTCSSMFGMINGLIHSDSEDERYREVFNKAMHSLGWFSTILSTGVAPPKELSGGDYTPVRAGLFATRREQLANYTPTIGFSKAHLCSLLGEFAFSVGFPNLAHHIFSLMDQVTSEDDRQVIINFGIRHRAGLCAMFQSPPEALRTGVKAVQFIAAMSNQKDIGKKLLDLDLDIGKLWSNLEKSEKAKFEHLLDYFVIGPAFAWAIVNEMDRKARHPFTEQYLTSIREIQPNLERQNVVYNLVREIDKTLDEIDQDIGIEEDIRSKYEEQPVVILLWYLAMSLKPRINLANLLRYHTLIIDAILKNLSYYESLIPSTSRAVILSWARISRNRRFVLSNPEEFGENLTRHSRDLSISTAIRIVLKASSATGINIPSGIKDTFSTVITKHQDLSN